MRPTVLAMFGGVAIGAATTLAALVVAGTFRESEPDPATISAGADARVAGLQRKVDALERWLAEAESPRLESRPVAPAAPPVETLVPSTSGPLPEASPERQQQIQRLATQIARDAEQRRRDVEQLALPQVREQLAAERRALEDAVRGGTMALLRQVADKRTSFFDLVSDRKAFAAHFERKESGPTVKGLGGKDEVLADGSTVALGPGVHRWSVAAYQHRPRFPRDLLVDGAGMDETLVVLDEIHTKDEIHALTFQDLTIDCSDNYLTDLRESPAAIHLERCRVVGFDMGAGGSSMLNARTAAFWAVDCRIEAGFGRAPGFGNLFDVRGGLIARLEGCTIVGPFRSVEERSGGATVVFSGCAFERMTARYRDEVRRDMQGNHFLDCTFSFLPEGEKEGRRERRQLSEINPTWPTREP